MSTPDRRQWFRSEGRRFDEVFHQEAEAVAARWMQEFGSPPYLLVTAVNEDWFCLDAWKWDGRNPPDQGMPPTEADIPVGFV